MDERDRKAMNKMENIVDFSITYFPINLLRDKLLSMRLTKDEMDKLSQEDRLMMYGYHDCINEILAWCNPRKV
jgi:hypothetical protein